MPSPIAHAIAGATAGWVIDPPAREDRRRVALYAALGMAADLDLLVGAHSGATHGLGAAVIVGTTVWVVLRIRGVSRVVRTACASAIAYASHTLLDWLGTDSSPPIGIMQSRQSPFCKASRIRRRMRQRDANSASRWRRWLAPRGLRGG